MARYLFGDDIDGMKNAARYFSVGLAGLTSIVGLVGRCVRMVVVGSMIFKQIQFKFSFAGKSPSF